MIKNDLSVPLLGLTDAKRKLNSPSASVSDIRSVIETSTKFKRRRMPRAEKIAISRMMSSYWGNSSSFSLDLVGAVIRQGSFIEKMHSIDWIHSPAVTSTMTRLIKKYENFFRIMAEHPRNAAVPTLDVDLAWHTHQLSPKFYYG